MNWKEKLEELKMTEQSLSVGIKKKINDYYSIVEGIKEVSSALKEADEDEEDNLKEQLSDLKEGLEASNADLIKSIEFYERNKDSMKLRAEKMLQGKKNKQAAKNSDKKSEEQPKTAEVSVAATSESKPKVQTQAEEPKEEKKSSNILAWVLGVAAVGIVAVVTLGKVRE